MTINKETIYIDVEDDITGIIDKVNQSKSQVVALVLPKRTSVLQSIVNMKLLKKTSAGANKQPVLITTESSLISLAGTVGMHVAPNLSSKPEIPSPPAESKEPTATQNNETDEIEEPSDAPSGQAADKPEQSKEDSSKSGKLKVPDFKRFRKRIFIIAGVAVLLIAFLAWAVFFAPQATIAIRTETSDLDKTVEFIAREDAIEADEESHMVPAVEKEVTRTNEKQAPATGERDKGRKARGSVSMSAGPCSGSQPSNVSAGTGISTQGLTYITQRNVEFEPVVSGGQCEWRSERNTRVVAQENGDKYNIGPSTFNVSGRSDVTATSDQSITGGRSNIVRVVSAEDIRNVRDSILEEQGEAREELKESLEDDGLYALEATFQRSNPDTAASPEAGTEASHVAVTVTTRHTMLGVKEADLKKIIDKAVEEDIDKDNQGVVDYGLEDGEFTIEGAREGGLAISLAAELVIGPEFEDDELKQAIFGMKSGEAESELSERPGFNEIRVDTSPFWVNKVPSKLDRISIVIEEQDDQD